MIGRSIRSMRKRLREIDRSSRRVERNVFDRAQGAAFVLALVIAPFATLRMETLRVHDDREPLLLVRVFREDDGSPLRAQAVDFAERGMPWASLIPLAEVEFTRRTTWCGWPFATSETDWPLEEPTRILGAGRERDLEAYRAVARETFAKSRLTVDAAGTRTHMVSWIFSIGIWWILLVFASFLIITPLEFAWRIARRTRTHVRQSRIDRCHCPNCGYNARESILRGICPECGSELYERPDYDG